MKIYHIFYNKQDRVDICRGEQFMYIYHSRTTLHYKWMSTLVHPSFLKGWNSTVCTYFTPENHLKNSYKLGYLGGFTEDTYDIFLSQHPELQL